MLLLLDRAGALDRLAAALRFVPFDDDFARPFADFAEVDLDRDEDDERFARPFADAGFLAVLDLFVVRDALALLRVLADLLALFGLARLLAAPPDFAAVVADPLAPERFGLVSAICPSSL